MIDARETVLSLVNVGRNLEAIERCLRAINAINVVNNKMANMYLNEARRNARSLVRNLEQFNLGEL
jgi:hypothetical protein